MEFRKKRFIMQNFERQFEIKTLIGKYLFSCQQKTRKCRNGHGSGIITGPSATTDPDRVSFV